MFRWVTRYSSTGYPIQVLEPDLPRIPDYLLDSVVYLYPSEAAAEDGERMGGSGFLFGKGVGGGRYLVFVVTNKHVIERGNMVVRLNKLDGEKDIIALDQTTWFTHPRGDDLAVTPIGLNRDQHKFNFVHKSILTKGMIRSWGIGPGDDIFFIGRFINHEGKQRNLPSVRFGNVAQMPSEPVKQDDGFDQECFLVEGRSIPGYSGSPVFLTLDPTPEDLQTEDGKVSIKLSPRNKKIPIPIGPVFLGIDCFHIRSTEKVMSRLTEKPVNEDWYVNSNTGMMGVIPSWKLTEMFEEQPLKSIIDTAKEAQKKNLNESPAVKDGAGDSAPRASDGNPTHREDFSRLLGVAAKTPPQDD